MRKSMKKPGNLSTQLTASSLNRINNCLPFFPGADETSKFTAAELLEILECSLPLTWRQKFDLDGYIPTDHSKAQLIIACEAIERSQGVEKEEKTGEATSKKVKFAKKDGSNAKHEGKTKFMNFYCSFHKKNATHDSADCYTLKNKEKNGSKPIKKTFSNKGLCQEINFLAQSSSKEKVLDMYLTCLNGEKAKLKKGKKNLKKQLILILIEPVSILKINKDNEKTEEEEAFLKTINAQEDSEEISDN